MQKRNRDQKKDGPPKGFSYKGGQKRQLSHLTSSSIETVLRKQANLCVADEKRVQLPFKTRPENGDRKRKVCGVLGNGVDIEWWRRD